LPSGKSALESEAPSTRRSRDGQRAFDYFELDAVLCEGVPGIGLNQVSRREAALYHHMLGELGGAHGREIREALGPANVEVYRAIRARLFTRARGPERDAETLELDAIDWAAIRVIAPLVLEHGYEQEFQMQTVYETRPAASTTPSTRSVSRPTTPTGRGDGRVRGAATAPARWPRAWPSRPSAARPAAAGSWISTAAG
jgi:hypothetical protein